MDKFAFETLLKKRRITGIESIQPGFESDEFVLHVRTESIKPVARRGHATSVKQLNQFVRDVMVQFNTKVSWVELPNEDESILHSLLLSELSKRFEGQIKSVAVSSPKTEPRWVWVECNPDQRDRADLEMIASAIRQLFADFSPKPPEIDFVNSNKPPSDLVILRAIKVWQPLSLQKLYKILFDDNSGFDESHWLKNRLDQLRKGGNLLRSSRGLYCLTLHGIKQLPTQKNRASSDVQRILHMARRRW